jgi:hypothetical protein
MYTLSYRESSKEVMVLSVSLHERGQAKLVRSLAA